MKNAVITMVCLGAWGLGACGIAPPAPWRIGFGMEGPEVTLDWYNPTKRYEMLLRVSRETFPEDTAVTGGASVSLEFGEGTRGSHDASVLATTNVLIHEPYFVNPVTTEYTLLQPGNMASGGAHLPRGCEVEFCEQATEITFEYTGSGGQVVGQIQVSGGATAVRGNVYDDPPKGAWIWGQLRDMDDPEEVYEAESRRSGCLLSGLPYQENILWIFMALLLVRHLWRQRFALG